MALPTPVCLQYLERCSIENRSSSMQKTQSTIAVKADSIILTDIKALPILLNLASTFESAKYIHPDVQIHVIPSSYKIGCAPKNVTFADGRGSEKLEFLKWCHSNLKRVRVFSPPVSYCQAAYLQALAASLSSQSVIVSSETFTSGFNGLGVLTLNETIPNCEGLIMGKPLLFERTRIVGVEVIGCLPLFTVSTDIVLQFIRFIRHLSHCIVEVWGKSLRLISLSDRIAISNMVKETNVSCIFFPCDDICSTFLKSTSNLLFTDRKVKLSKAPVDTSIPRAYDDNLVFDLNAVETSISGPKRETDRILLKDFRAEFQKSIYSKFSPKTFGVKECKEKEGIKELHGSVIGVSLAGCTNSSNAFVTLHAGLLAKSLIDNGFKLPESIKGVYATGAGLADLYLSEAGLSDIIVKIGLERSSSCCVDPSNIKDLCSSHPKEVITCALLSGNGNYEKRKFPGAAANYLMSSPLALLLAAAGNLNVDLNKETILLSSGESLQISDIWPTRSELIELECKEVLPRVCARVFKEFSSFSRQFEAITVHVNQPYPWNPSSLYILRPPYMEMKPVLGDVTSARVLLSLGDNVSSELISPSGSMGRYSTAAHYLSSAGLAPREYDSYGNRRGNHNIVAMGIFNNSKLKNYLVPMTGPYTKHIPSDSIVDVYEAARMYKKSATPMVVITGSNYGCGPTRDSGARGLLLLGISAVIARSFHNNHRTELLNQGLMPVLCEDSDCIDVNCEVTITWHSTASVAECEGRLSWAPQSDTQVQCTAQSDTQVQGECEGRLHTQVVQCTAPTTTVSCNGSARVRLAVYSEAELELLRCGGLLGWRVRDVERKKLKQKPPLTTMMSHHNHLEQKKPLEHIIPPPMMLSQMPLPNFNPVQVPNLISPYYAPPYQEVVHFVPIVQYVPVRYTTTQTPNFIQPPHSYPNM